MLAPNGVEEERGPGYVEYAIYGGEGELPELGEIDAVVGERPDRGQLDRDPRRLGRPLARLPQAAPGRRAALAAALLGAAARGRDRPRRRPRPGLRHRRPPDHPPLPRVPAGAAGAGEAERTADRPRHRLRRARDRRRQARLGPGRRLRPRAAGDRGRHRERHRQRRRARPRAHEPARTPSRARANRRRQHDRADPAGGRGADGGGEPGRARRACADARRVLPGSRHGRLLRAPADRARRSRRGLRPRRPGRGRASPRWATGRRCLLRRAERYGPRDAAVRLDSRPRLQDRAVPPHPRRGARASGRPSATRSSSRSRRSTRARRRRSWRGSSRVDRYLVNPGMVDPADRRDRPAGDQRRAPGAAATSSSSGASSRSSPSSASSTASSSRRCARRKSWPSAT